MSSNINVSESPKHFIVLDAVSRGVDNVGKIAKVTKIQKAEVEMILNDLSVQRLIVTKQKVRLFGIKLHARATDTGRRLLYVKKQELEEKAKEIQSLYRNGDRKRFESFMNDNRVWIPMMIFSGIMSAMLFTSMMSVMGMAMSPTEAAMAADNNEAAADGLEPSAGNQAYSDAAADTSTETMDAGGFSEV
jgi:DNA-binding MarR family transcriptional regulator